MQLWTKPILDGTLGNLDASLAKPGHSEYEKNDNKVKEKILEHGRWKSQLILSNMKDKSETG